MANKTSKESANLAKRAAAKRVAAKTAKSRKAVATASAHMSVSQRIDKRIADLADWRGERLAEIRALIHEVDPEVVEEWKWMGSPVWSHLGMYALANAHKDKVKLTFHHGAELRDPKKLFNAGLETNKWRAINFREGDAIDTTALKRCFARRSLTTPRTRYPRAQVRELTRSFLRSRGDMNRSENRSVGAEALPHTRS